MAQVTAPAFALVPGPAGPVRVAGLRERFGPEAGSISAVRGQTASAALHAREVRMQRAIARYGTVDTSPRAQKQPVLMDDPRGTVPARAVQPQ